MERRRVFIILFLFTVVFIAIILRILELQWLNQEHYLKLAKNQYYTSEEIFLPRGIIYDRNGKFIAISVPKLAVWVVPKYIKDKEATAKGLSNILGIPYEKLLNILNSRRNYTVVANDVDIQIKPKLLKLRSDLKEWNIGITENNIRFYPNNQIAGSTIGCVSRKTGKGLDGIEYLLDNYLGGGQAKFIFLKDAKGNPITIEKANVEKLSYHAVLTIDINIQYIAEEALNELVFHRDPLEASILILDPKTGEILASATYPNYDPNSYYKYRIRKNINFQHAYEVGSLAKPFILAQAVEERKVNMNETIDCLNGAIDVDGVKIRDHKRFGILNPVRIIQHSSNVGAIKIALRLDGKRFIEKLKMLGFGEKHDIFPGEASGLVKLNNRPVDIAYGSIGQNWTATPLQIAIAYSVFANGGYRVKPILVKGLVDSSGKFVWYNKPKVDRQIFSKDVVDTVIPSMVEVIENGTAKAGKSNYFTVAGKTGTAQKYDPAIRALSNSKWYTWFAGFFPVSDPKFVVVIFANEPKPKYLGEHIGGGGVSADVLKLIVDRIMFYYKQKPDKQLN
ncbi:MAG: penicillin-binding protein 2 [Hydrogenothermaceae bacterium]|nr:penicillin-binding protein 2 [Hydrogenothermaceae bacterium]